MEEIGNDFDLGYQAWPLTKEVSPLGHFLARLTPDQERQLLEIDRSITFRLEHPKGYEILWVSYADQDGHGWTFRCLDEDDVHVWDNLSSPASERTTSAGGTNGSRI